MKSRQALDGERRVRAVEPGAAPRLGAAVGLVRAARAAPGPAHLALRPGQGVTAARACAASVCGSVSTLRYIVRLAIETEFI